MNRLSKLKYRYDKIPEVRANMEPLTLLMVRKAREANNYIRNHANTKSLKTINTKDINLLHSIDRDTAIKKLLQRVNFLKINREKIKLLEKKNGFLDLSSDFFLNSPFTSINSEIVAEVAPKKYMTLSGVGRICAIKICFPQGLRIKITVGNIDPCLKKNLIAVNNLFIYSGRFSNLKRYGINEKEIIVSNRILTKKCYRRGKYLKRQTRKLFSKFIPIK